MAIKTISSNSGLEGCWITQRFLSSLAVLSPRFKCDADETAPIVLRNGTNQTGITIRSGPTEKAIAETRFTGYVGHEFMPTRDPLEGLREAVAQCNV